ncbi:MAG: membrane protein insertase YidC [Clostridia bacterium]|nr:membrane protein insertase YidC [Clostridia bacterium]
MDIMYYICLPLGYLMKWCWMLVGNYGWAIILFTLATKLVLLPLSVWIHKNTIQMVKIQPDLNFLKVNHYGDLDTIADEQGKLYKKHKYHPMLSLVPLIVQVVLLLGVVEIIYHPLSYLFAVDSETVNALAGLYGIETNTSSFQLTLIEAIKNSAPEGIEAFASVIEPIKEFSGNFLGFNLSVIPSEVWGIYTVMPIIAGLSSFIMCWTQNMSNVLQHEQSKFNQYGMTVLSVGISLYLGIGVPAGIAWYWVAGNLLSIAQMYILNAVINPKKYVDYEALEKSRKALADIEALESGKKKDPLYKEHKAREKKDYKRFFHVVNKHLVIYSEKSGFYKYFEAIIDALLKKSNITIHYITNDPDDAIFALSEKEPRIRPYYIGLKKMIPLMMRAEADIMLMTTPDLDKFYIKRSIVKKDMEYVYVPHDMMSMHMGFREGALDAFDTIFCTGPHIVREVRATEKVYGLPEKKLVEFGYPFADKLIAAGEAERATHITGSRKEILIAPSWQEDNLLDSCIDHLINGLFCDGYHITVRPHPEYVKRYGARMQAIVDRYAHMVGDGLSFELDFTVNKSVYSSDLLITDWSGIALEFCFATRRPALFVNTAIKCMNPNWKKIDCVPTEISLRDVVGVSVDKDRLDECRSIVEDLLASADEYDVKIGKVLSEHIYNQGHAGETGADYLLKSLVEKRKKS